MITGMLLLCTVSAGAPPTQPITGDDAARWLRWVVPLPKEARLTGIWRLPPGSVVVEVDGTDGLAPAAAAGQLREMLGAGNGRPAEVRILLLRLARAADDPLARKLSTLACQDQAYLIVADERGLVVAALADAGLYYGAQTLRQLIEGRRTETGVDLPVLGVVDWPDLEERGEWGGSSVADIEWLAGLKMNLVEAHTDMRLDEQGHGVAKANEQVLARAREHALKLVPILTHLDQLGQTGIYDRYPELAGKGEGARYKASTNVAPCLSNPILPPILAQWMTSLWAQEGVAEICAWLGEVNISCGCDQCRQEGQWVMEARALVKAWREAIKSHPELKLRILLTQGSYPTNDKVLAEIPPEIGVTYYDGGRTYDSSREPMIYPLLERFAAQGRWLGCYPQLTASWRIVCPFTGPQFIRARMTEFVDKKLRCLCGYATPDNRLYDFNVTAAAEWSWHARGRDEREFALAWATRRRFRDPAAVADWAVTIGPVGWDLYGGRVPWPAFPAQVAAMIARKQPPAYGQGFLRYFDSADKLAADRAVAERCLATAEALREPELVAECEVITGYLRMLQAAAAMATLRAAQPTPDEAGRAALSAALKDFGEGGMQANQALRAWEELRGKGIGGTRLTDTIEFTEQALARVGEQMEALQVENPFKGFVAVEIGQWATADFDQGPAVTKVLEVTRHLAGPGRYEVGFKYTSGWNGLTMQRVALAASPAGKPDERTELMAAEHPGTAAARNKDHTYLVDLPAVEPGLSYWIVAAIRGTPSAGRPISRQGCNGSILLRKIRPDE